MLLVEAWQTKILATVQRRQHTSWWSRPHAQLVTVESETGDRHVAGAIFVQQLTDAEGRLTNEALMIGIHRMPSHKSAHRLSSQSRPTLIVTDALVHRVKLWCMKLGLKTLLVCPYQELGARLRHLGFVTIEDTQATYTFGSLDLRGGVCEDGNLHAHSFE